MLGNGFAIVLDDAQNNKKTPSAAQARKISIIKKVFNHD